MEISVIKANGQKEPFSEAKLRLSLNRAGVPGQLHNQAITHIKAGLRPDIPTGEIYGHILEFLGRSPYPHSAVKYSLKKSIMDLGPTGFPFEKFVAAILRFHGYKTSTDKIISGLCVAHEIDVIAEKENTKVMVECKFHNNIGIRTDIKVALYVMARYQDLTAGMMNRNNTLRFNQVWLVTNTKCSQEAIVYAKCMGMKIISWGYPEKGNLQEMIETEKLQPVTCLNSISAGHKKILLDNNIVLVRDLIVNKMFIDMLNLSNDDKNNLNAELQSL